MRAGAFLAVAAAVGVAWPAAAVAQTTPGCSPAAPLEEQVRAAPVVFTGRVTRIEDEGRDATVDVARVWRGGPLPPIVHVRGTVATQSKVHTALDRVYSPGATYLFLPSAGTSPRFVENACSSTTPFTAELDALAPAGGGDLPSGISDLSPTSTDTTSWLPLAIGGTAFVGLGALLLAARRRGRRTH